MIIKPWSFFPRTVYKYKPLPTGFLNELGKPVFKIQMEEKTLIISVNSDKEPKKEGFSGSDFKIYKVLFAQRKSTRSVKPKPI